MPQSFYIPAQQKQAENKILLKIELMIGQLSFKPPNEIKG
jgi:hypothetical protein